MAYTALPDRRIPFDNDGTRVGFWGSTDGVFGWLSGAQMIEISDNDYTVVASGGNQAQYGSSEGLIFFFPEQREITAIHAFLDSFEAGMADNARHWITAVAGSNDSTNGLDGTWETATLSAGVPTWANNYSWRSTIKPVSFTGGKRTIRVVMASQYATGGCYICHLYGEKTAGQTPDDLIFIDHDTTPGVEYTAPEDFGDRPLATTVTRQFRVKNASATKTANTINLQCNDADFAISTDGTTWVATINIASLGPGAESSTMYIRNTTPAVGSLLGPRFGRIVATVASWT